MDTNEHIQPEDEQIRLHSEQLLHHEVDGGRVHKVNTESSPSIPILDNPLQLKNLMRLLMILSSIRVALVFDQVSLRPC